MSLERMRRDLADLENASTLLTDLHMRLRRGPNRGSDWHYANQEADLWEACDEVNKIIRNTWAAIAAAEDRLAEQCRTAVHTGMSRQLVRGER